MKKLALVCILSFCLLFSGCLGPNNLIGSIENWNAEVTEQNWLAETSFIGLHIVPVYPFAYLGDILILNTIDYWSGENPISDPGPFPASSFTNK